ncbi:hypothetical protein GO003_021205 [Methylicorpusculum oleiharenae]|uniref:DUF6876 family protein n=1 Tax=Methylicorpusculum oleiharenae TaxID=1338687 RepID=UPI001356FCD7|nr:DUF6876 family protein [Methylicorpusculum oleiharenae]MCD2452903.1 hypothetical protein [Methylicorpusculum oleiharenae]
MTEANPEQPGQPERDAAASRSSLNQFTGTERWYRHPFNPTLLYTDGVKYLAEHGGKQGAYWLLDTVALEIAPFLAVQQQAFGALSLTVNPDKTAVITVTDGNDVTLASFELFYTDLHPGDWRLFLIEEGEHRILLLPSEY